MGVVEVRPREDSAHTVCIWPVSLKGQNSAPASNSSLQLLFLQFMVTLLRMGKLRDRFTEHSLPLTLQRETGPEVRQLPSVVAF